MIGSFSFNGIDSSVFGLVCKSVKRPLLPARKINRVEVLGASGTYDFDSDTYSNRPITIKIAYIGTDYSELRTRAREIAAWLSISVPNKAVFDNIPKLIINDEPDKYYIAKVTEEIDLDSLYESGTADIEFDCQPFSYSNDVFINFTITGPTDIPFINPGNRMITCTSPENSMFAIYVEGSWSTISFTTGFTSLEYPKVGVSRQLLIDNITMEAIVLNGEGSIFGDLTGDVDSFLKIYPGENSLHIDGTDLNITGWIQYKPMWI